MLVESSLMSVTALVPVIGYQKAAEIARESWQTGKTIREIAGEKHRVPDSVLDSVLDVTSMAGEVLARDENVATDELRWGNRHYQKRSNQSVRLDRWRDDGGHE